MTAITISREILERACVAAGIDTDSIRPLCSSRGMYGRTCLGLVVDDVSTVALFLVELTELAIDGGELDVAEAANLARRMARRLRTDSMGTGIVAYFPGVTVEG